MKLTRRRMVVPLVALASLAVAAPVAVSSAKTIGSRGSQADSQPNLGPQVVHTGTAPTGYEVTFRYYDPSATRVQIKGEWYFANPYQLDRLSGTSSTDVVQSPGTLPTQWQTGDVPLAHPNSTAANWPVTDMTEVGHSGVWTFTTPLPSGVFTYGFFVNCTDPAQAGCRQLVDPANPPWNKSGTGIDTTPDTSRRSQVYVPSDPKFGTQDLSWQAPNPVHGSLADVTYPAPTSTNPVGHNFLGVYTPPGYDPHRAQPYPTLYMLAPDDEVAWTTQGALNNILDNLIDDGEIQPMVLVSANLRGFPASSDSSVAANNLINSVIPFVEEHYNVSTSASQRALGSLGNAGSVVHQVLYNHTSEFGYYGVWAFSAGQAFTLPTAADLTADQIAALKKASILIGGGYEDPWHYFHASEIATLTSVGVPVHPDFVLSGHDWYTWRIIAKDFITRVAFFPSPTGNQ